ncbi:hypothetical protein TCAL_13405, partial [Tigriopus californicus]
KEILEGFPDKKSDLPEEIRSYWGGEQEHLSLDGDLILYGERLVIPRCMRKMVLQDLHSSHQGQERTKRRARQVVFWPNLNNDVNTTLQHREQRREHQSCQRKEPIMSEPIPDLPFQNASSDLFEHCGFQYLVCVDRLSDGRSPAMILYGRPLESFVFAYRRTFAPGWLHLAEKLDKKGVDLQETSEKYYNRGSRHLRPLRIGDYVDVQDFRTKLLNMSGQVMAVGTRRDYYIRTPSGRVYWRNRRFLRPRMMPSSPVLLPVSPKTSSASPLTSSTTTETTPTPALRRSSRMKKPVDRMNIGDFNKKSYV